MFIVLEVCGFGGGKGAASQAGNTAHNCQPDTWPGPGPGLLKSENNSSGVIRSGPACDL